MSVFEHMPGADAPTPKRYTAGTHRIVSPAETVERVRELMPAMGITRIANVTGLDSVGIPVVMVCRPNSRSLAVAQGKGVDLAAATASGLMESAEFHHAEYVDLPLKLASYEEMRTAHATIDVNGLARLPESLYRPSLPLLWVEGYDVLQQVAKWLPFDAVHTNFTVDVQKMARNFIPSSNGLASGNHLLEAMSQGIAEVVERDAVTLFGLASRAHRNQRRIDLETVDDPLCREVLGIFDHAGVDVGIWDTTSDIGIPTFRCLISERRPNVIRPLPNAGGFGCHPSRSVALLRALTEAAQSRLTLISGSRDDMFRDTYERAFNPGAITAGRSWIDEPTPRDFHDVPNWESETLEDDIDWQLQRLRSAGITEVVVVDLTKPELDLPVAKVVVPHLEFVDSSSHRGAYYEYGARARRVIERRELEEAIAGIGLFAMPQGKRPSPEPDVTMLGPRAGTAPSAPAAGPEGATTQVRRLVESGRRPDVAIFTGPTLTPSEAANYLDAVYLPPVSEGDVYRVAQLRPRIIGIIDGYFERVPAVWHKEILWAMSEGIHVFGAASMGALRAAELEPFGMEGVGEIFTSFRSGVLTDDDEVAVMHAPGELEYQALSEAMVDIRATLRQAVADRLIRDSTQTSLEDTAKKLPYPERTYDRVLDDAARGLDIGNELEALRAWLAQHRVRQKRADAIALLETIRDRLAEQLPPKRVEWTFQPTVVWQRAQERAGQFVPHGSGVDVLRTDALLQELRLDPDTYASVRQAAMLRRFAEREATQLGSKPDREAIQQITRTWQEERGLRSAAEMEAWLASQDLTPQGLSEILRAEAVLSGISPWIQSEIFPFVLNQLRLTGEYSRLRTRAQHKQEVLTAMGLDNPTPDEVGVADRLLLNWYFEERLRQAMPPDLDAYAHDLGFIDRHDLLHAVRREYCYLQACDESGERDAG